MDFRLLRSNAIIPGTRNNIDDKYIFFKNIRNEFCHIMLHVVGYILSNLLPIVLIYHNWEG